MQEIKINGLVYNIGVFKLYLVSSPQYYATGKAP